MSNMPTTDQLTLLALCRIRGLSWYLIAREAMRPKGLERLLSGAVTENSAEAREAECLLAENLSKLDVLRREAFAKVENALSNPQIKLTTVLDADYPVTLKSIFNRPPFLFYIGELRQEDALSVAVVGTRKPTSEGLLRAKRMARLLAEQNVTVVSGLARGIDTAAHIATLETPSARTIAAMGTGILRMYPPENRELADRITEHGAIVSQFWPDSPPTSYTFPRRNITMSGIGQGTIVIEASSTSGAKLQARYALEHGKKVFLLESLVKDYSWAQGYLKRGAIEVSKVEDVLAHLRSAETISRSAEQASQLSFGLWEQ